MNKPVEIKQKQYDILNLQSNAYINRHIDYRMIAEVEQPITTILSNVYMIIHEATRE